MRRLVLLICATTSCTCSEARENDAGLLGDVANQETASDALSLDDTIEEAAADLCVAAASRGDVIGCDYVAVVDQAQEPFAAEGCMAAVVTNSTDTPISLAVTFRNAPQNLAYHANNIVGEGHAVTYGPLVGGAVAPHSSAVISLFFGGNEGTTQFQACPNAPIVPQADTAKVVANVNGTASGFRIQTSAPTSVYAVWPYTPGDSGYGNVAPLRAVPSWAQDYIDVGTLPQSDDLQPCTAWTGVVANIQHTIIGVPSADLDGSLSALPTTPGVVSATLSEFDFLSVSRCDALIGQHVSNLNSFSLWTGKYDTRIPTNPQAATDNRPFVQVPQPSDWGHTYVFARQDARPPATTERTFMRIIARSNGTQFTYTPSTPSGAPTTLDAGESTAFWSSVPFVVTSQDAPHSFFIMAHMVDPFDFDPTVTDAGNSQVKEGSNAMHIVPAMEHWANHYDLFMPFNYPASELVIVRAIGSPDLSLDCAGAVAGWQAVDATYEFTRVWISKDDNGIFNPQVYGGGTCDNGMRTLTSTQPFGVTVYGWISLPFATYSSPLDNEGSSYAYSPLASHSTIAMDDGGSH